MLLPLLLAQIEHAAPNLPPAITARALAAAACADRPTKHLLIADMSQPSSSRRLWVLDLSGPVPVLLEQTYVAHGAGSDPTRSGTPKSFSNALDSNKTSLGLAVVSEPYAMATHPKAYRLDGLTKGFDDQMRARGVVLHPGDYVTDHGVGRSNGCPALAPAVFTKLDKEGALAGSLLWIDGGPAVTPTAHCAAHLAPSPWPLHHLPTWATPATHVCTPEIAT
jgi:hypothetical protein